MIRGFYLSTIGGKEEIFVPFDIEWNTTSNNSTDPGCADGGWVISNQNTRIRFNVSDSANCGGTCDITQVGVATAIIQTGSQNILMDLDFEGLGEAQAAGAFERIEFRLNNTLLARGSSAGGGLGCAPAIPIVKEILVEGPYNLLPNTQYEFRINFTTGDRLFHVGAFYEINLSFTEND